MEYSEFLKELIRDKRKYAALSGKINGGLNIAALFDYIRKHHPDMLKKLEENIKNLNGFSRRKAEKLLKKYPRLRIVKWSDPSGKQFFLLKSSDGKIIEQIPENKEKDFMKQLLLLRLIKKDIEHITGNKPEKETDIEPETENKKSFDSSFDGQFKKNLLLFKNSSPSQIASVMLNNMSDTAVSDLSVSLQNGGVNSKEDFESLINKWKDEALSPSAEKIHSTRERESAFPRERSL